MGQTIRIAGIVAEGRHGARDGERDRTQSFSVDLEVAVGAQDDDLGTTADYREVVAAVRSVVEEESYRIIETLAERVAQAVAAMPGVRGCRAAVHKPAAADRLRAGDVSAEAFAGDLGR